MVTAKEHYDTHLAPHYSWMMEGNGARERFADLLCKLALNTPEKSATALDLGAGNGAQSIPLAEAGYLVTVVDFSALLLGELGQFAATTGLSITTKRGDLREIEQHCPTPAPDLVVCMGDTLTHLSSAAEVAQLIRAAASILAPKGYFLLGFRDYYSVSRQGAARFIPVKSDDDRILLCFLDYGPEHVAVHDIFYTRQAGGWKMRVSVYPKVRLNPAWVIETLSTAGFDLVDEDETHGFVTLAARRRT